MVQANSWVRIITTILDADQRSANLPEDTKKVPVELWVKGFLLNDAELNDTVKVRTLAGREVEGKLIEVNPMYELNYGNFVKELLDISEGLKEALAEVSND